MSIAYFFSGMGLAATATMLAPAVFAFGLVAYTAAEHYPGTSHAQDCLCPQSELGTRANGRQAWRLMPPEVAINRQPAVVIKPPVRGNGWLVSSGCCKPDVH